MTELVSVFDAMLASIKTRTENKKAFTAFEIAVEIRACYGFTNSITEIKKLVKKSFFDIYAIDPEDSSGYKIDYKQKVNQPIGFPNPMIYYHIDGENSQKYADRIVETYNNSFLPKNSDGRINIPKKIIRQNGFKPGQVVYVHFKNDRIVLSMNETSLVKVFVNRDFRIRLNKNHIKDVPCQKGYHFFNHLTSLELFPY